MKYIFIHDGCPEAEEYNNNYIYYDPNDKDSIKDAIMNISKRLDILKNTLCNYSINEERIKSIIHNGTTKLNFLNKQLNECNTY